MSTPNPQQNIKELERKLGKYNNTLESLPGFTPEDYYSYVDQNFSYFSRTGEDPTMYYARRVFRNKSEEVGGTYDPNYASRMSFDQIVSAIDSLDRLNAKPEEFLEEPEAEEESESLFGTDSLMWNGGDSLMWNGISDSTEVEEPEIPLVPLQEDKYSGRTLSWTRPSFKELHPEYDFLENNTVFNPITGEFVEANFSPIAKSAWTGEPINTTVPKTYDTEHHFVGSTYYENAAEARQTMAAQMEDWTSGAQTAEAYMLNNYGTTDPELLGLDVPNHALQIIAAFPEVDWGSTSTAQEQEIVDAINASKKVRAIDVEDLRYYKRLYREAQEKAKKREERAKIDMQKAAFERMSASQQDEFMDGYTKARQEFENNQLTREELSYLTETIVSERASGTHNPDDLFRYSNEILDKILKGSYIVPTPLDDGTIENREVRLDPTTYVREFDKLAASLSLYYADNYMFSEGIGDKAFTYSDRLKAMSEYIAMINLDNSEEGIRKAQEHILKKLPKYEPPKKVDLPWWADVLTLGVYTDSGYGAAMRRWGKTVYTSMVYLGAAAEGTVRAGIDLFGGSTPEYAKDLGFFERWGAHIGSSTLAQHAYETDKTGSLGWHVGHQDHLRYGYDATNMDDRSKFWTFMADSGFSTAATIISLGTGAVFKKAAGAVTKQAGKLVEKKVINQAVANFASKAAGVSATVATSLAVGASEGLMNAADVYNSVLLKGQASIDSKMQQLIDSDFGLKEGMSYSLDPKDLRKAFKNPEMFEFISNNSGIFDEMSEFNDFIQSEGFIRDYQAGKYSDEWINAQYSKYISKLESEMSRLKPKWENDKYSNLKKDMEHNIETNAWEAYAGSAAVDIAIVSVTDLFFSKALAPSLGKLAEWAGIPGLNRPGALIRTVTDEAGNFSAKALAYQFAPRLILDVVSEGTEEMLTFATDETAKTLALLDINNYFYNTTSNEGQELLSYGLWNNLGTAARTFGNAAFSDEGWYVFGQGAIGALVGSLNVQTNTKARIQEDLSIATNWWEKTSAVVGNIWRNPLMYHTMDRRRHIIESNRAVQVVNDKLASDPKLAQAFQSTQGTLAYMDAYFKAKESGDSIGMEESEFGMYVSQANVIAKLKGTSMGKAFQKHINEILNATVDSELGQQMANRYIELLDIEDKTDYIENPALALEKAKEGVKKFSDIQKGVTEQMSKLDAQYGGMIDDRTKEAIAYTYMTQEEKQKMLEEREGIVKHALTRKTIAKDNTPSSNLTDAQKAAVAEYGSYENALAALNELKKQNPHKVVLERVKEAVRLLKEFEGGKTPVLNIKEILALSPKERAQFFRDQKKYSAEQRAVISKFKENGLGKSTLTAIEESGRIQEKLDTNESILESLEDSDLNVFRLKTMLEYNATLTNAKKKTEDLVNAESYEEFEKKLTALIETGKLTPEESAVLGTYVFTDTRSKGFYDKFTDSIQIANSNRAILKGLTIKVSNKKTKKVIAEVLNILAGRMRSKEDRYKFSDAENLFMDGGFIETIKSKYKLDWNSLLTGEKHRILSEIKRAMDSANKALDRRDEFDSRFNAKQPDQKRPKRSKYDIFNVDVYNSAKDTYDAIFEKVIKILDGQKVYLSHTDIYQLASLFDDTLVTSPLDVDRSLFKGLSNSISTFEDLLSLYKNLRERRSYYEDTADIYGQYMQGVLAWIRACENGKSPIEVIGSAIAELNPDLRDRLDTSKKSTEDTRGVNFKDGTNTTNLSIIPFDETKLSEAHYAWYEEHNVAENINYLLTAKSKKDVKLILVREPSLYEAESTYTSDDLPLAVAVEVPKGTANSVEVDGLNVLYVGIVGKSRQGVSEKVNILNAIRDTMLANSNDTESWVIRYDDTKNPITFGGWNYEFTQQAQDEVLTNLKEKLLYKYSHLSESERTKAAFEDFCENTVQISCEYAEENGKVVRKVAYTWKGKKYNESQSLDDTTAKSIKENGKVGYKYTRIGYIENAAHTPTINFLTYNFYNTSYLGNNLVQIYEMIQKGEIDLYNEEFKNTSLGFLHEILVHCDTDIFEHKTRGKKLKEALEDKNSRKAVQEFLDTRLNSIFSGYLNLHKPKRGEAQLKIETSIFEDESGNQRVGIYIKDIYTGKDLYSTSISTEDLIAKDSEARKAMLQDLVFNTFLDIQEVDGKTVYKYRTFKNDKDEYVPIVNTRIDYRQFTGSKSTPDDSRLRVFESGILETDGSWEARKLEGMSSTLVRDKKPTEKKDTRRDGSEVDVVDNTPTEVTSSEAIQKALDILAEHKLTSTFRDEARSRGAMGVTTFINDGNKSTLTKEALVATEVGTSLDYVVRKFIEFGGDADKTYKYIFETFSHHTLRGMKVSPIQGLDWKMLKTFIDNISTLKSFFESRGEVIVPFDTAFNEVLKSDDGSYANLTAIPDIITIDGKGELHIYDMKSYLASGISLKAFPGFNKGTEIKVARGAYLDENAGEGGKWQQQTSLYAHVVEKATGLKVASIGIVPIPVRYSSAGTKVTEDAISGIGVKSITNADGSQFKLDKVPTFYIDAIKLDILPLSKIKSNVWQNPLNEEDQREPEVETVSDEDNGDAPSKDPEKPIKELVPKVDEKPGGDVAGDDFGFGEFGGRRGRGRGRNTSNGNPKETDIIKCG